MPLPVRLLMVLIHLRTNLTTRALAALFGTSQPTRQRERAMKASHQHAMPNRPYPPSAASPNTSGPTVTS
jgi:Helix-turn-helix of DDE superfamily endonuclease